MTVSLTYEIDFKRVMSAVISDSQGTIPSIKGKSGAVIYGYIQSQIALVVPGVLVYRVVGNGTNLGGYCGIYVGNGIVRLSFLQLRPAFQSFESEILQFIATFIQNNIPLQDISY